MLQAALFWFIFASLDAVQNESVFHFIFLGINRFSFHIFADNDYRIVSGL